MRIFRYIIPVGVIALLSTCDFLGSDSNQLPPVTTEGRNTFGCLIDGTLFVPDAPLGYGPGVYAELYRNDTLTSINIYAGNGVKKQSLFISLLDKPKPQVGVMYDLMDTTRCGIQYLNYVTLPSCEYKDVINGNVTLLKFDIANSQRMIISGTFEFTTSSLECNKTSIVTSGRFDISDVTY